MQGAMKTMAITRLTLLATVVLVSGMSATGAGLAAYRGVGRKAAGAPQGAIDPAQKTTEDKQAREPAAGGSLPQPSVPAERAAFLQKAAGEAQERVKGLMREFEADQLEFRKVAQNAQNLEEKKKLARNHRGANPAFYAGAFLDIAEKFPGTPAAEDGLLWIATHLVYSSMAERAKEVLAQDFARNDKIEPLFSHREVVMAGSKPTERLFRAALAQNGNRKNQGLACYYLARYLDYQASFVRLHKLLESGTVG